MWRFLAVTSSIPVAFPLWKTALASKLEWFPVSADCALTSAVLWVFDGSDSNMGAPDDFRLCEGIDGTDGGISGAGPKNTAFVPMDAKASHRKTRFAGPARIFACHRGMALFGVGASSPSDASIL